MSGLYLLYGYSSENNECTSETKEIFEYPLSDECQMVDVALLNVKEDNMCKPKHSLKLEEIWIFREKDEKTTKNNRNLSKEDKA